MQVSGHTSKMILIFNKSGHGGFKTEAKLGAPLADDEETETFAAEQSFGDVLISVTGTFSMLRHQSSLKFYFTLKGKCPEWFLMIFVIHYNPQRIYLTRYLTG